MKICWNNKLETWRKYAAPRWDSWLWAELVPWPRRWKVTLRLVRPTPWFRYVWSFSNQRSPPKHQRHASQHGQIEAQQWQAQAPGDINRGLLSNNDWQTRVVWKPDLKHFGWKKPESSRRSWWLVGRIGGSWVRRGCLLLQTTIRHTEDREGIGVTRE